MKASFNNHELMRRSVWSDAWVAASNANDCKSTGTAKKYADSALEHFDELFKPLPDEHNRIKLVDDLVEVLRALRRKIRSGEIALPTSDVERIDAVLLPWIEIVRSDRHAVGAPPNGGAV